MELKVRIGVTPVREQSLVMNANLKEFKELFAYKPSHMSNIISHELSIDPTR